MRKKLYIFGTSGFAKEVAMLAEQINSVLHCWDIAGFIGEPGCDVGKSLGTAAIVGDDAWLLSQNEKADLALGVGFPNLRHKISLAYKSRPEQFSFPNLIHPNAIFDYRRVELGKGNLITAGCIFTCDIVVADFNLFNLNTTVGHDVVIGNCSVFNPGTNISGDVRIGDRVLVGTGVQILEHLEIGSDAIVGAGSVVTRNVNAGQTVIGVPAKPMIR